jgi:acetyl esterase
MRRLKANSVGLWSSVLVLLCVSVTYNVAAEDRTPANDKRLATWLKKYPEADANKDGVLTMEEAKHYQQELREKRGGKQHSQPQENIPPSQPDVKYGPYDQNVLDFYKADSDASTPVLVFFHGGGFTVGNKQLTKLQQQCLAHGISAASANYRLTSPKGITVLESMRDGARVIQFLRSKAEDWNIDPNRIAVSGSSAGGCISVWLATSDDLADPANEDPISRYSSRVLCACGAGAQTTLDLRVILAKIGGNKSIHSSIPVIYDVASVREGLSNTNALQIMRECSALNHVTGNDAPLYLTYGTAPPEGLYPETTSIGESIHSAKFGLLIKEKYDALGLKCTLNYPGHRPRERDLDFLLRQFGMAKQEK